jgi:hypothetical protein
MRTDKYLVVFNEEYMERMSLRELAITLDPDDPDLKRVPVWSARLGTGAFGYMNCKSGNRGPKDANEVILAPGYYGLTALINLGFITCSECKPEQSDIKHQVTDIVYSKYGLFFEEFLDKSIVPYDAARVEWEKIFPLVGRPGRIYLRTGATQDEVDNAYERLQRMDLSSDDVGYMDRSNQRFVRFAIPRKYL